MTTQEISAVKASAKKFQTLPKEKRDSMIQTQEKNLRGSLKYAMEDLKKTEKITAVHPNASINKIIADATTRTQAKVNKLQGDIEKIELLKTLV